LSREPFKGLKAILDSLSSNREALREEWKARIPTRISNPAWLSNGLTKQIHVQDCYSRLGTAGGIKDVLPYHDVPTQSSLPTLVNFDSTVTATPKSAGFFNQMLTALRRS